MVRETLQREEPRRAARPWWQRELGVASPREDLATLGEVADDRIRDQLRQDESKLLAEAPGNVRVDAAEIATARMTKRAGVCTLRVELLDGRTLRWHWLNLAMSARYEQVARSLALLLGPRLRA